MHDVEPRFYTTVIREMLRHENDVTNHRIMWLLIVQGLIANAVVGAQRGSREIVSEFAIVGILVTLSAFIILYKSYQARGYLQYLGREAKRGTLREHELPLLGWPGKRIKGWRKEIWICPWLGHPMELLEPFFFLPGLLIDAWLFVLLHEQLPLSSGALLGISVILTALMLAVLCVVWVWVADQDEEPRNDK